MPNTSNYNFEYESPTSLPGTTLTGGSGGGSPVLAQQVDSALAAVETKVDADAAVIASHTGQISSLQTGVTNLGNWTRSGVRLVTFTSRTTFTTTVTFGFTFPSTPVVMTNIATGSGQAVRWSSRATNITTTGFTLFVYDKDGTSASAWDDIPVAWLAHRN